MTVIVGVVSESKEVVMVGDAAASDEVGDLTVRADTKVFHVGPFLIGCAGSYRTMQVVRYCFSPPEQRLDEEDDMAYLVGRFIPKLQRTLEKHACRGEKEGVTSVDGYMMLGYHGALYTIDTDFHVAQAADNFTAIGVCQAALGALYALQGTGCEAYDAALIAAQAAERTHTRVRGPFTILTQPAPDE